MNGRLPALHPQRMSSLVSFIVSYISVKEPETVVAEHV